MRIEETKVREMSTNEGDACSDAGEEGALTDGRSTGELHTTECTRQHSLVVAEVMHMSRISLCAQQQIAWAAEERTECAPMLHIMHINGRRRRSASVVQPRPTRPHARRRKVNRAPRQSRNSTYAHCTHDSSRTRTCAASCSARRARA